MPEKRKRKRASEMTDQELAEVVFGKRLKKALDQAVEEYDKKSRQINIHEVVVKG